MPIQMLTEIEKDITHFLSQLIKINTTNPPGNEVQAADFIAKDLAKDGFSPEIIE